MGRCRTDRHSHRPPHGRGYENRCRRQVIRECAGYRQNDERGRLRCHTRRDGPLEPLVHQGPHCRGQRYGEIKMLVNAAGVSPSQVPIEAILKVYLYGTAVLLEKVGRAIAPGGVGVTISSQSCWRMPALTAEQGEKLATTPTEELLSLDFCSPRPSVTRSMPIRWRSAATRSASRRRQSNGASAARA